MDAWSASANTDADVMLHKEKVNDSETGFSSQGDVVRKRIGTC